MDGAEQAHQQDNEILIRIAGPGAEIVRYEDYLDPVNAARLFGMTESLVAALQAA